MVIRNIKRSSIATIFQLQYILISIKHKEELNLTEKELLKTDCQLHKRIKIKNLHNQHLKSNACACLVRKSSKHFVTLSVFLRYMRRSLHCCCY
jgi:hypothetical protein